MEKLVVEIDTSFHRVVNKERINRKVFQDNPTRFSITPSMSTPISFRTHRYSQIPSAGKVFQSFKSLENFGYPPVKLHEINS